MPWRCPACGTKVQHTTDLPRTDRVYRCPICRLQMVFDPVQEKMQPLAPNGDTEDHSQSVP
jgi:DNA-directed RNA polymerase subunit RPC12/RpoP